MKLKIDWSDSYKVGEYACEIMIVATIIAFVITREELFLTITVLLGFGVVSCSELSDKQHAIECYYRTSELRNERIDMLTEENQDLGERIEDYKKELILEQQRRASAERKLNRMEKFMEQAGVLYISSDTKRKDAIPRKRRSKQTTNKK